MLGWLALIVAALAGLFVLLQNHAGSTPAAGAVLPGVAAVACLAALSAAVFYARRSESRGAMVAITACLFALLLAGVWWVGWDRVKSTLYGQKSATSEQAALNRAGTVSVLVRKSTTGQFVAQGRVNDSNTAFLIDTGASAVMLKYGDAEKAGVDLNALSFTTPIQTANGTEYAAPIRIRSLSVGLLVVDDVEALVAKPGSLNENLLGMSFLRRLSSYGINGDFLTLRE
jgi:aspartyl protease family protein